MIQSVRLKNWRSHQDSFLEFKKGTNVLVGPMGGGKTSVMDGICFGLFGTFPALNSRKVSIEETLMQKPQVCDSASIQLSFSYRGKNFAVERTIFRGNRASEAKLHCEDRLIAGPKPSEVTERIEKELEVDYSLFSRAVYSEQNQIDFFLRLSPRERKQKFDEILEINRYENARQNMLSVGNRIKKTVEDQKKLVLEQEKRFRPEELEKIGKTIREKKIEKADLEQQAEKNREKAGRIAGQIVELEKAEKQLKRIREAEIQTATKLEQLQERVEQAKKAIGEKSVSMLEAEIQKQAEQEKELLRTKKEAEQKLELIEKQFNESRQETKVLESRERELEKSLGEISRVSGKCPVCRKELQGREKKELEKEIREEQQKIGSQMGEMEKEQQKMEMEQQKLAETIGEKQRSAEESRQQKMLLEISLKQASEIEKQLERIEAEKQKLAEILWQQKGISFDEKQLSVFRQELLHFKTQETKAVQEARACQQLVQTMEENARQLEGIQNQLSELKTENKQLEKTVEKVVLFTNSLQAIQSVLRENMLEAINQALHSIWQKVYPYADLESCSMVIQGGDYEIMVRNRNGEWMRAEGNLSGGERSTVALCIRMAFSFVLTQNLGWLILDEPTHNLDALAVQELAKLLKNQLPELVEQSFIVTHDKEMEQAASGSLYEIVRDKNSDGISLPQAKPLY